MNNICEQPGLARSGNTRNVEMLVDGHVHIHPTTDVDRLLDSSHANFSNHANSADPEFALLLTESEGCDQFQSLKDLATGEHIRDRPGNWLLVPTKETESVRAVHESGSTVYVIAGRQIVTRERLEVLAICTSEQFEDGIEIREAIDKTIQSGGIAVIPWGFGKWTGRRGRIVRSLFETTDNPSLLMGDNGGRLQRGQEPKLFAIGRKQGLSVLAGTDPLPFRREFRKVGRYGTRLRLEFDENHPAESIRRALTSRLPCAVYGTRERLLPFIVNQCRMQFRTRAARFKRKFR